MLKKLYTYHQKKREFYGRHPLIFNAASLLAILLWVFAFKSVVLDANNIPSGSMTPTLQIGDFLFVNKMRYTLNLPFTDIQLLRFDEPARGDIVTFTPPADPSLAGKTLVKRVVAVPGDRVKVIDDEIFINDQKYAVRLQSTDSEREILNEIDYPDVDSGMTLDDLELFKEEVRDPQDGRLVVDHYMLKHKNLLLGTLRNPGFEWVIPPGKYMVMGDNRDNSDDSRRWGLVDIDNIHGKVFMIYFSVNWGRRFNPEATANNPLVNLVQVVTGRNRNFYVRWNRIGNRVY